jgi:hypothetical protein
MHKKFICILFVMIFCLASVTQAEKIIWVTESTDNNGDGLPDDHQWVEWVESQGFSLDVQRGNWTELDAAKISTLNAADLIIISRSANSGSYDETGEATQWNSITTPMISTNIYFARSSRWLWMNTTSFIRDNVGSPVLEAVGVTHSVFFGITLDQANQAVILDDTVSSANNAFLSSIDVGNGKLIAKVAGQDWTWIAEWEPGVEFYAGAGQYAGGRRLLFCAGTQETTNVAQGELNLNENGRKMFLNAINYMLGRPLTQGNAHTPHPVDAASGVERNVILGWTPGEFAGTHNVYFGTNFDDVNDADTGNPLLVSPAQDANTYEPGILDFEQTYYWRVDEISAPPDSTIFKGNIWSFTVESIAYPIAGGNITATASSHDTDQGPEKTIDGSGLIDDLHSNNIADMWITSLDDPGPAWIQYQFDKTYKLHEMLVWNYNGPSFLAGLGFQDVVVEYSMDGTNWTALDGVPQFAKATGTGGYAYNTTIAFNDTPAQYVRITAASNWFAGTFNQFGLSEVRFTQIPVRARQPSPEVDATDVAIDTILGWRSGREAVEHNLYLSNDAQAVIDGTAPVATVTNALYGPLSLDLGKTYYWRVDEVNDTNTWQGETWNFTTRQYLVVDNFESYNDIETGQQNSNLVYETWTDGYTNPSMNGSTIGYPTGHSMETTTVHGGRQSVPLMYDNSVASISEITVNPAELAIGRDWTIGSPEMLVVWVFGDPNNSTTDQMYVKINSAKVIYSGDLTQAAWQQFLVDLAALGIDLSNVTTLTIGFERKGAVGGSGMVFIDDIWLYTPALVEQ